MILTALQKLERAGQVANLLADLNHRDAEDVLRATLNVIYVPQTCATATSTE